MSSEQGADTIWYILVLVLVGSALVSRRISLKAGFSMLLVWSLAFAAIAGLYARRTEIARLFSGSGLQQNSAVETGKIAPGGRQSVRIDLASDNHYWVDGTINGRSVRFLIDSGATITAISEETARSIGLTVDDDQPGVIMQTANGRMIARRSNISGLDIGGIRLNDLSVVVAPGFGDVNVLGMNFLSRLKSWRVENGEMILER